jgi:hypothetical protein
MSFGLLSLVLFLAVLALTCLALFLLSLALLLLALASCASLRLAQLSLALLCFAELCFTLKAGGASWVNTPEDPMGTWPCNAQTLTNKILSEQPSRKILLREQQTKIYTK